MMRSGPGASYESPLVLDDDSPTVRRKKRPFICIDEEDDRKMPARPLQDLLEEEEDDEALASRLQVEEWGKRRRPEEEEDAALAAKLYAQECKVAAQHNEVAGDASLAAKLQQEEEIHREKRKRTEDDSMRQSLDGRAWLFVNQVLDLAKRLAATSPGLTAVSVDDMVFLAKKFLQCQADFQADGLPTNVTLAYHYTRNERMDSIKQDGLVTLADRKRKDAHAVGGCAFGDGVYTATNPYAFYGFNGGKVGLLVAVVLGSTKRVSYSGRTPNNAAPVNTVIGNKMRNLPGNMSEDTQFHDEYVLQESRQCLPLVRFDTSLVSSDGRRTQGNDAVWTHHKELQKLLDQFFNGGIRTELTQILPPAAHSRYASHLSVAALPPPVAAATSQALAGLAPMLTRAGISQATAARILGTTSAAPPWAPVARGSSRARTARPGITAAPDVLIYQAPETLNVSAPSDVFEACSVTPGSKEDCAICIYPLRVEGRHVVKLKVCGHIFHRNCMKEALKAAPKCPVCRKMVQKPQGHSPSGTMHSATSPIKCSGFEPCPQSIVITYSMPSGVQKSYHENPGQRYQGTSRIAYLPDNDDGRKLLKRLKYAWMQGLTFTIGTSLTTGMPNCITWSSIHHKTSPTGSIYGFPDPGYFANCNEELDSLGVPKVCP